MTVEEALVTKVDLSRLTTNHVNALETAADVAYASNDSLSASSLILLVDLVNGIPPDHERLKSFWDAVRSSVNDLERTRGGCLRPDDIAYQRIFCAIVGEIALPRPKTEPPGESADYVRAMTEINRYLTDHV